MENLIVAIALYIVIVAIAYCPNKTAAIDPVAVPINYFPDVEKVTEAVPVDDAVLNAIAIAPAKATKTTKATLSTLIKEELSKPAIVATVQLDPVQSFTIAKPDLSKMGVRDLYKLASQAGIQGYKKLTKPQLIAALV